MLIKPEIHLTKTRMRAIASFCILSSFTLEAEIYKVFAENKQRMRSCAGIFCLFLTSNSSASSGCCLEILGLAAAKGAQR